MSSLDQTAQLNALLARVASLEKTMNTHEHDGKATRKISASNVTPSIRAMGSITMATNGQTYKLGVTANPTSLWFYGSAVHWSGGTVNSGSINIRAFVVGNAQLGKSYYFQPSTSNSVVEGGLPEDIIQTSSAFLVDSSTNPVTVKAPVGQLHLVDVFYPAGTNIVARATVTLFSVDHVEVQVILAAGWEIVGNFVVT